MCIQGRMKWRNCGLTHTTPDYQLGWAVWTASKLLDTQTWNFVLCGEKSPQPTLLHNIKGKHHREQSGVPPLCPSLCVFM
jgi:hypothetical protein